ncbi:MAG: hypothetical protein BGO31_07220 [Bacteroidetes bacterium 43-16]|nr:MAG: hypothetical protein BGO31_07220 [Bacteroidetes bacterium 43-16]
MEHLLLLHGALGHPGYFDFIKEKFSGIYTLHTPVFEGHAGEPFTELSIGAYVAQINKYCMENDLDQVSIFGYSMGGYVGLCYAAQFPEKVTAIMTLATKLNWSPEIAAKEAGMLDPAVIKEKVPRFADYLHQLHGEDWEQLCSTVATLLSDLGAKPLLTGSEFGAIRAKAQLMVGDKDNMVSVEETFNAARQIKESSFAVLPATIHPFEKVNRPLVLKLMEDFFKV